MKLCRFNHLGQSPYAGRLGLLMEGDRVVDLRAAAACLFLDKYGRKKALVRSIARFPPNVLAFLELDPPVWNDLRDVIRWLVDGARSSSVPTGLEGEPVIARLEDVRLHAAVRPNRLIVVDDHAVPDGAVPGTMPQYRLKPVSSIIGPARYIEIPIDADRVAGRVAIAAVIGRPDSRMRESATMNTVAGYTVVNDVVAIRQRRHIVPDNGDIIVDGATAISPWFTTIDEVSDVDNLRVTARVGETVCQDQSTADLNWSLGRLVQSLSGMDLKPGDLIVGGGVGLELEGRFDLGQGDVIEGRVHGIGTVHNVVTSAAQTRAEPNNPG